MKKWLLVICAVLLCACSSSPNDSENTGCDAENLVQAEENNADMSGYGTLGDAEHVFYEKSMEEIISMFEEKQSGIIYFGYVGCPWCAEALPIMDEVAKAKNLTISYAPVRDEANQFLLTKEVQEKLFPYLDAYLPDDEDGEKSMYVPLVVVVKNGEAIAAHEGTVDTHPAYDRNMNDSEKIELTNIYQDMFAKIAC